MSTGLIYLIATDSAGREHRVFPEVSQDTWIYVVPAEPGYVAIAGRPVAPGDTVTGRMVFA